MSRNYNHIIEAKFRKNLLDISKIPLNVRKKWNRWNFDKGYYTNLRNKKRYDLSKYAIIEQIREQEFIDEELWNRFIHFCDGCSNDCQSCFYFHSA